MATVKVTAKMKTLLACEFCGDSSRDIFLNPSPKKLEKKCLDLSAKTFANFVHTLIPTCE